MEKKPEQALFRMILVRTIGPFLILILAFLAFFCVLLSMMTTHNTNTRLAHQEERLRQSVSEVEERLLQIDYAQREIVNSQSFSQFAYMYDDLDWYSRYALQNSLQEELLAVRNTYDYVQSVWLFIPSIGKVISDTRTNASLPQWLGAYTGRESSALEKRGGMLINAITRSDEDDMELAILAVVLDEREIEEELQHVRSGDEDRVAVCWERQIGEKSPDRAQLKQADIRVEGVSLPLQALYFSAGDGTDQFVQQVVTLCMAFVLLVLLGVVFSLVLWYRQIYTPLHRLLIEAFGRAEAGDLKYRISIQRDSPFYPVYDSYNHMMEKMEAYVENNLKQQILVSRANLKQLQSQISPHFMYNSYYVLYRLIKKGDQESALRLAEHLGQFYHYVTRNADDEKHLDEEVEHARTYAAIQKFRFRDALDMQIDMPDPLIARAYVPRLILQPLLENAFKYAYETESGGGVMMLRVRYEVRTAHRFDIIVENSGCVTEETLAAIRGRLQNTNGEMETTALVNIHRRLRIYFGEESGLQVDRSSLGGLLVRMRIEDDREEREHE